MGILSSINNFFKVPNMTRTFDDISNDIAAAIPVLNAAQNAEGVAHANTVVAAKALSDLSSELGDLKMNVDNLVGAIAGEVEKAKSTV